MTDKKDPRQEAKSILANVIGGQVGFTDQRVAAATAYLQAEAMEKQAEALEKISAAIHEHMMATLKSPK